jgi:hypothetical protein
MFHTSRALAVVSPYPAQPVPPTDGGRPARLIAATAAPLTLDEQRWVDMITRIAPVWFARVAELNAPFRQVTPPARPQVVLGHGGGDDAFGTPPDVMAFDLSALATAYADRGEAAPRR